MPQIDCLLDFQVASPSFGGTSLNLSPFSSHSPLPSFGGASPVPRPLKFASPSFGGVSSNLFPASSYSLLPGPGRRRAEPRAPLRAAFAAPLCRSLPAHRLGRRPPHSASFSAAMSQPPPTEPRTLSPSAALAALARRPVRPFLSRTRWSCSRYSRGTASASSGMK